MSPPDAPTQRPTAAVEMGRSLEDPPTDLLDPPRVDVHNHARTLSWEDREKYALSGCEAMVMVAAGYHWTPYNPVHADDIRYLWDDPINRRVAIQTNHAFRAKLAVGIYTGTRENPRRTAGGTRRLLSVGRGRGGRGNGRDARPARSGAGTRGTTRGD